jgi:hypothetical protein
MPWQRSAQAAQLPVVFAAIKQAQGLVVIASGNKKAVQLNGFMLC